MNICGSSLDRQPDLCEQFHHARRVHQESKFPSLYLAQGQIHIHYFPEIPSPLDHGYHVTEVETGTSVVPGRRRSKVEIHTMDDYDGVRENDELDDN